MITHSIVDYITEKDVIVEPFPHIEVENPYPMKVVMQLIDELPSFEKIAQLTSSSKEKKTLALDSSIIINHLAGCEVLKAFMSIHTAKAFTDKVLALFQKFIPQQLPGFKDAPYIKSIGSIVVNAPCAQPFSPRYAHVDNKKDIFVMLYYLRHPEDYSNGGDLELYQYKDRFRGFDRSQCEDTHYLPPQDIVKVKTIPYQSNRAIILLDGINSIHGVTPRIGSKHARYYLSAGAQSPILTYNPNSYLNITERIRDNIGYLYQHGVRNKLLGHRY